MASTFLGLTSHGPGEGQSPTVNIRERAVGQVDRLLANLTPVLVRHPAGHVITWPAGQPIKPGFTVLEPVGIDKRVDIGDGQTESAREAIHRTIEHQSHRVLPWPRRTGRRYMIDGEIVTETIDDTDITKPVQRG